VTFAYWTMDIADPDELVSFAVDNTTAGSFFTDYNDPDQIEWTHQAQSTFDKGERQENLERLGVFEFGIPRQRVRQKAGCFRAANRRHDGGGGEQ